MAIKVNPQKRIKVEFTDMMGQDWGFEIGPIPISVIEALQQAPERITKSEEILNYVKKVNGPVEGDIQDEKDVEQLKEAIKQFADVLALLNTAILKLYAATLERFARAEKNSVLRGNG